jgi:hypothetical protein
VFEMLGLLFDRVERLVRVRMLLEVLAQRVLVRELPRQEALRDPLGHRLHA